MSFTEQQKALLEAPLSRDHVKTREQGKKQLSYIEGWVAIKEANRIFGFDGWHRETILLQETNRTLVDLIGTRGPYQQWRVGYIAKVRVTVSGVVREGTGYGSGFAPPEDLGGAVESAIKESETDAMKRALMTFGNPFGLALYDKEQAEVEDAPSKPNGAARPTETVTAASTVTPASWAQTAIAHVKTLDASALSAWEDKMALKIASLRPVVPDLHKTLIDTIRNQHVMVD